MAHGPHIHDSDEIAGRHLDWQLFRRFLGFLSRYRRSALGALLVMPLAAAAKLVQPYLLKVGIDEYIVPGQLDGLGWIALLFILLLFGESLLTFIQTYLVQLVGQRIMADLRGAGFRRLLRLPAAFFDRHPSGRLVTRLTSDIENVGELFGSGVVAALGDILTLVAIVGVMLWLDLTLSLVAFAVLPPLLVMVLLFRVTIRRANRQVRARLASLNAFIAERIAGASEVRLFGQEQRTLDEFEVLQQNYRRSTFTVINWDATLYAVVEALGSVAIAAILWKGGGEIIAGAVSFGTLVAFIEYVQKFFAPLRDLSAKYSVIQASNASLERIFDLLDRDPEPAGGKPQRPGQGEVRLERVDFSYDEGGPVLHGVDLQVAPGENVALVGDTGSGKTTIARLLLRFYAPSAGRILLDGQDLSAIDPVEVRRRIGWISQEPFLFDGSVRENIDPESFLDDSGCEEVLRRSGALDTVRRLGGLSAHIAERGKNLSAGERQLLCLARALATDPDLLIMDEATSRLDVETEEQVRRGAEEARRGRSALLIAHRLRSIRHADRIVVLRRGRVQEEGTHRELMARNGLYARLWRLQALEGKGAAHAGEAASARN